MEFSVFSSPHLERRLPLSLPLSQTLRSHLRDKPAKRAHCQHVSGNVQEWRMAPTPSQRLRRYARTTSADNPVEHRQA
eukprot:6465749-Amphidinium_carterae.1